MSRLTDPDFKWTSAAATNIAATWRKHGWKPTTDRERAAQQRKPAEQAPSTVLRFRRRGD